MEKPSVCLCSREGPTYQTLTVAVEQWDIYINCQPEWPKCKPNLIYACYFSKVIILPCIKCNISLVLFSPGSVEAHVRWGGKLKCHLMASSFRNICTKNRQNPLILFKVTADNVGVPFLRHSVYTVFSSVNCVNRLISRRAVFLQVAELLDLFSAKSVYPPCTITTNVLYYIQSNVYSLAHYFLCRPPSWIWSNRKYRRPLQPYLPKNQTWSGIDNPFQRFEMFLVVRCRQYSLHIDNNNILMSLLSYTPLRHVKNLVREKQKY